MTDKKKRVTWHTAFFDAIRLELEAYIQRLTFMFELPLIAEPLRIDTIIIKEPDVQIDKPIGRIFRQCNIIEYKSPEDILSLWHFHKSDFLRSSVYVPEQAAYDGHNHQLCGISSSQAVDQTA
jgi:hypothetical protein